MAKLQAASVANAADAASAAGWRAALSAETKAIVASTSRAAPVASKDSLPSVASGFGLGSFHAKSRLASAIGARNQNTPAQPAYGSRMAPTIGPSAPPMPNAVEYRPSALVRYLAG